MCDYIYMAVKVAIPGVIDWDRKRSGGHLEKLESEVGDLQSCLSFTLSNSRSLNFRVNM